MQKTDVGDMVAVRIPNAFMRYGTVTYCTRTVNFADNSSNSVYY